MKQIKKKWATTLELCVCVLWVPGMPMLNDGSRDSKNGRAIGKKVISNLNRTDRLYYIYGMRVFVAHLFTDNNPLYIVPARMEIECASARGKYTIRTCQWRFKLFFSFRRLTTAVTVAAYSPALFIVDRHSCSVYLDGSMVDDGLNGMQAIWRLNRQNGLANMWPH